MILLTAFWEWQNYKDGKEISDYPGRGVMTTEQILGYWNCSLWYFGGE